MQTVINSKLKTVVTSEEEGNGIGKRYPVVSITWICKDLLFLNEVKQMGQNVKI